MITALFPLAGAIFGALQILDTILRATSAPQEAAGMAMACAYAIVPYVFARSIEMMRSPTRPRPVAAPVGTVDPPREGA